MIITCKKAIPLRWVAFTVLPWASFYFDSAVIAAAFVFSLKKFVENPAGLTFVLSLPGFIAIVVASLASFLSDRVWTRFGRRKPFVVTGMAGMLLALVLMPLMPNLWGLLGAYLLYHTCDAISAPRDSLKQEIVPPSERGRATGAMTWCGNLASVAFYSVLLGRFDDVRYFAGFPLYGENVIYWTAALMLGVMMLLVLLGIKEVDQKSPLRGQKLSVRTLVGGLFDRELSPVYLLVVSYGLLNFFSGFGPFLSTLLYTDQWGYSKQDMGLNIAIGGTVNVFIIGLLTVFADRLPRMRAFQGFIYLSLAWNAFYFCYVNFILPDRRPSLIEIIVFGEVLSILSILLGLIYIPLTYDYVRRNKMGTFGAGAQIATRVTQLFTLNGVGLFVWAWASFFQPPAGEMTRVVLREPVAKAALVSELRSAAWTSPRDAAPVPPAAISAQPWQADGVVADLGRAWEIRWRDSSAERLAAEKKRLEAERAKRLVREKLRRDHAAADGAPAGDDKYPIADLARRIAAYDADLTQRAAAARDQIVARLGNRLIDEGAQLRSARRSPALVLELATRERPDRDATERMVDDLRKDFPALIDLRPLKRAVGYGLAATALLDHGDEVDAWAQRLRAAVEQAAARRAPGLLVAGAAPLNVRRTDAFRCEIEVVEEPTPSFVSPVTRLVNAVLSWFDRAPEPTRRLAAVARSLRLVDETNHVRVTPGTAARTIAVVTVFESGASRAAAENDNGRRLRTLLGDTGDEGLLLPAQGFCARVEKAAATQRLTVVHPVLAAQYAPMRYDYMSGYLWVLGVGLIGLSLTYVFRRLERRGIIRKRGREEAEAS